MPDHSGQGAALKLNSSIPYQYIRLIHSPKPFNQSFTISVWVNPDLPSEYTAVLMAQVYQSAPIFGLTFVNRCPRMRVYGTILVTSIQLKNFQWQYVTFCFRQADLLLGIYIDGILISSGRMITPVYGDFQTLATMIGAVDGSNQYNGLIDQFSIAYFEKNRIDVLDEATLVVCYTFEDDKQGNDSIFNDQSANSIHATGAHVTRLIDKRGVDQRTLRLENSTLSWFRSAGFVLLVTHNYTYSYSLWLHLENASSFIPLVHLVANNEMFRAETNDSTCLVALVANSTDPSEAS